MKFTFNQKSILEPRASIQFQPNTKNTVSFAYGLHGQLQPLPVYLYEKDNGAGQIENNHNLGFSKAHHFVLGYENRFAADWRVKAEIYYQHLFNIPVESTATGFSMINAGSDFAFPQKAGLLNKGTGENTGVELTVERFLSKGYYILTTVSLFNSTYKGSDGVERSTTYDYGYATNVLAGREWKIGKSKTKCFYVRFQAGCARWTLYYAG
jgi:hypothetical protein